MSTTDEKHTTLPCAVCRKALERMDANYDIPYAANIFVSYGHEGATAYDSPGGEHLELLICTDCLNAMKDNAVVDRVLHATEATPMASNPWGSPEDPHGDNPWNKQRLRNEWALTDFFDSAPAGMTQDWAQLIFDACQVASREGRAFDPSSVHSPAPGLVPVGGLRTKTPGLIHDRRTARSRSASRAHRLQPGIRTEEVLLRSPRLQPE